MTTRLWVNSPALPRLSYVYSLMNAGAYLHGVAQKSAEFCEAHELYRNSPEFTRKPLVQDRYSPNEREISVKLRMPDCMVKLV